MNLVRLRVGVLQLSNFIRVECRVRFRHTDISVLTVALTFNPTCAACRKVGWYNQTHTLTLILSGSGKTLAYLLPALTACVTAKDSERLSSPAELGTVTLGSQHGRHSILCFLCPTPDPSYDLDKSEGSGYRMGNLNSIFGVEPGPGFRLSLGLGLTLGLGFWLEVLLELSSGWSCSSLWTED